jgi:hypothetical protein
VQGKKYRWQVHNKSVFRQGNLQGSFYLSVELVDSKGKILLVDLLKSRNSNYLKSFNGFIKPQDVSKIIIHAIQKGWKANEQGLAFRLNYSII